MPDDKLLARGLVVVILPPPEKLATIGFTARRMPTIEFTAPPRMRVAGTDGG